MLWKLTIFTVNCCEVTWSTVMEKNELLYFAKLALNCTLRAAHFQCFIIEIEDQWRKRNVNSSKLHFTLEPFINYPKWDIQHRGTVWEYLLEKWCRGVEYGKLSPWHPWTRAHCPPNQTVLVLGVIHKWSFWKALRMAKNVIYGFGLVL